MTRHVHPCPECYEHPVCSHYDCTIEPDMQMDDGTPSGSFVVCGPCTERLLRQRDEHRVDQCTRSCPPFDEIAKDTPATIVLPGVRCRFCKVRWRDEIEHQHLPGQKFMSLRGPKSCSMCEPSSAVDRKVFDFFPFYRPATVLRVGEFDGVARIARWDVEYEMPMRALIVRDEGDSDGGLGGQESYWFRIVGDVHLRSVAHMHARLIVGYRVGET